MLRLNKLFLFYLILSIQSGFGQTPLSLTPDPSIDSIIQQLATNPNIPADSLTKIFSGWNRYSSSYSPDQNYIITYKDPYYGNVPMRLYIPKNYSPQKKSPLVLILHGAVGSSSFERAGITPGNPSARNALDNSDLFFDHFKRQDYIILRPFADMTKKFDWVINDFNNDYVRDIPGNVNLTYSCLINAITSLKKVVNIDDNKVFAFGHSDGADGVFGLEIFQPSFFAGFLLYNSLLANLKTTNNYVANIQNFPTYIVHSDLDNLRPVEQITAIVDSLKKLGAKMHYEIYHGYKHVDDHLRLDIHALDQRRPHLDVGAVAHEQPGIAVGRRQDEPSHRPRGRAVPLLGDRRPVRVDSLNLRIAIRAPLRQTGIATKLAARKAGEVGRNQIHAKGALQPRNCRLQFVSLSALL